MLKSVLEIFRQVKVRKKEWPSAWHAMEAVEDVTVQITAEQETAALEERAEEIGAIFEIDSRVGAGTQVSVIWS